MPELPEVETTMNAIKPYVLGQKVSEVIIRQTKLRYPLPKFLAEKICGQVVKKITRRGKYILFQFVHGTLILHLGMSGRLFILLTPNLSPPKKHDHVDIIFANKIGIRFCDPRRFGALLWTDDTHPEESHPLLKELGIDPLLKEFTGKYLFERARNRKVAVKAFIMNSKIVVGVGNIYATESLFKAGVHPLKAAGKVMPAEFAAIAKAIQHILKKAIKAGGTTFKDFASPSGAPGYFSVHLNIYGKQNLPCPKCKTKLISLRIGERNSVYCRHCQK